MICFFILPLSPFLYTLLDLTIILINFITKSVFEKIILNRVKFSYFNLYLKPKEIMVQFDL